MAHQPCAIVGIGQTHHKSRRWDVSLGGLVREAASRALAHASSGPCLQQNLVLIMEGND